jgi:hypothetical protein
MEIHKGNAVSKQKIKFQPGIVVNDCIPKPFGRLRQEDNMSLRS